MYQGSILRGLIGGMIICVLMAMSASGQPTIPLSSICQGLDVLQPLSPLYEREIEYYLAYSSLGQLRRRIDQGLHRMQCAQQMLLRETTLERRLPYEEARQRAADAIQEGITGLHIIATAAEEPLLHDFNQAFHTAKRER